MAYNENLADKIRQALAHLPGVEEKKVFGGVAFGVNPKGPYSTLISRLLHLYLLQLPGRSGINQDSPVY